MPVLTSSRQYTVGKAALDNPALPPALTHAAQDAIVLGTATNCHKHVPVSEHEALGGWLCQIRSGFWRFCSHSLLAVDMPS